MTAFNFPALRRPHSVFGEVRCMLDTCLYVAGPHKFSSSVSVRIFIVRVWWNACVHRLDLGFTSLPNDVGANLSDTQRSTPTPAGIRAHDLWHGRGALLPIELHPPLILFSIMPSRRQTQSEFRIVFFCF